MKPMTSPTALSLDSFSAAKLAAHRDEQLLVERVRFGDPLAFELIFRRYYHAMCGVAENILHSRSGAEDVVQDVFLSIWTSREHWRVRTSLDAYLRQAARNTALSQTRRTGAARSVSLDHLVRGGSEDSSSALADAAPSAEQTVQAEDTAALVASIERTLPPRVSEVYRLSRKEGLSNRGIAEQLGISIKTVELHITRALTAFRSGLSKHRED